MNTIRRNKKRIITGSWGRNDIRRIFVEGVAWWEWKKTGATLWPSDRQIAEEAAEHKYKNVPNFDAELKALRKRLLALKGKYAKAVGDDPMQAVGVAEIFRDLSLLLQGGKK